VSGTVLLLASKTVTLDAIGVRAVYRVRFPCRPVPRMRLTPSSVPYFAILVALCEYMLWGRDLSRLKAVLRTGQ